MISVDVITVLHYVSNLQSFQKITSLLVKNFYLHVIAHMSSINSPIDFSKTAEDFSSRIICPYKNEMTDQMHVNLCKKLKSSYVKQVVNCYKICSENNTV